MIPLKDDVPTRSRPVVTVALIAINLLVYLYQFFLWFEPQPAGQPVGQKLYESFLLEFGLVPCRLAGACPPDLLTGLAEAPKAWLTVFTAMFVHGGLLHVGGNMLYLWIFGNNVEDAMGRARFLGFYLLCGVVAALAQYLQNPGSAVPMVGASGAVSGVLGAYLVLHPHARVWTLVIFGFFWRVIPVPALVMLGFWFLAQVLSAYGSAGSDEGGGVAFLAHVGGFVAGMLLVHIFRQRPRFGYSARG